MNTEIVDIEIKNRSNVTCNFSPREDHSNTWTLELSEEGDRPLEGRLTNASITLSVKGTRKLSGGLPAQTETGYAFSADDHVTGAVEVVNRGAVWLPQKAESTRDVLAAAATALLLVEDLRAHLPSD